MYLRDRELQMRFSQFEVFYPGHVQCIIITFQGWTQAGVVTGQPSCDQLSSTGSQVSLAVSGQSKTTCGSNILFTRTFMPPGGVHGQTDSHLSPVTQSLVPGSMSLVPG